MQLSVITPQKKLVENLAVSEIIAPGIEGQLDILPSHASFVTEIETGVLKWKLENGPWVGAAVSYGWLEVNADSVTVLADVAELGSDLDMARAKAAEARARKSIETGGLDDSDFRKHELKLQRAMSRQAALNQ